MKIKWRVVIVLMGIALIFSPMVFGAQANSNKDELQKKAIITASTFDAQLTEEGVLQSIEMPIVEERDFVGSGLFSNHTSWLNIPKHVELAGNPKLAFYLSHSGVLSPSSTLTIWVNDQPVHSMNLKPETTGKSLYEIEIPLSIMKEELNSIEFRFFTISNVQEPCQDLDNPANWVVVHKDSYLQIPYKVRGLEDLSLFPEPYVLAGKFNQAPLGIVLPENPRPEDRNAAAVMVQYLALRQPFLYSKISTILGKKMPKEILDTANLISVGTLDRNAFGEELKGKMSYDVLGQLTEKNGLVAMIKSPGKQDRVITMISGANMETLTKSARVLTEPTLLKQMKGSYEVIDASQALPPGSAAKELTHPTFKELGYFTTKLAGTFESTASFQYASPANWELLPGTSLTLDLNYSPLLNPENSIMTVVINDKPVQSFKFTGRDGKAQWTVRIPDEMLGAPAFYILVKVNLEMNEKDCTNRRYDQAWVVIHDTSFFHIFRRVTEKEGFESFPSVFYGEEGLKPLKIIIPDEPTASDYSSAFNVIYSISSLMPKDPEPRFEILTASETSKETLASHHLVLIGTLSRNKLSAIANNTMPLSLDPLIGKPMQTRIKILPQFLQEVAALELAGSPWSLEKKILFISGETEGLVELATLNLLNRGISSQWEGDIVLINSSNQWFSHGKKEKKNKAVSQSTLALSLWGGAIFIISLLLGFLLYWRHKHSLRDPFKDE